MGLEILALQRCARYEGHEIRVQKTSLIHRMQYSLTIDGRKHDQLDALAGTFSLHGVIAKNEVEIPVEVVVHQGFFTGRYTLYVAGTAVRLERVSRGHP